MPVEATGIDRDGQMALPEQPSRVGWYRFGARPGSRVGSAVLAGHVDSERFGIGPLARLRSLRPGDRVVVTTSRGQVAYEVVSVRQVRKQREALAAAFDRGGKARLSIITCGGRYLRNQGGYTDNVVVTAEPIG